MKELIEINYQNNIPLIGLIHIGIIDRGTSLLQIRPSTICNMNCSFCSTDSGIFSKFHKTNSIVDKDYLTQWLKEVIKLKNEHNIEANIDSVGEPTTYPQLVELISDISKIPNISFISMQTNGTLLTKDLVSKLENAGLNRINLSLHTLNKEKGKLLFCSDSYNLDKVLESIDNIIKTKIELCLTPVWMPNINDEDIEDIIKFAKERNIKLGIQKYEIYKYSRKIKNSKKVNFYRFYKQLESWEKKYNIKLKLGPIDYNIRKTRKIPLIFKRGEIISAIVKCKGWLNNQMIAMSKNRAITVNNCNAKPNSRIKVMITENKNSIYLAKKV